MLGEKKSIWPRRWKLFPCSEFSIHLSMKIIIPLGFILKSYLKNHIPVDATFWVFNVYNQIIKKVKNCSYGRVYKCYRPWQCKNNGKAYPFQGSRGMTGRQDNLT